MIANIAAIGGLLGLIGSILLLAWQTREVARQTKISSASSGRARLDHYVGNLQAILTILAERPELRAYFYSGKGLPDDEVERSRVMTVAEMYALVLEVGLVSTDEGQIARTAWAGYSSQLLMGSPALCLVVHAQPTWFGRLYTLASTLGIRTSQEDPPVAGAASVV